MKQNQLFTIAFLLVLLTLAGCGGVKKTTDSSTSQDDGKIKFTILQLNDVYEIGTLEGGTVGGMARVATLRRRLVNENSNTLSVLAGDFLSPSLVGTMKVDGERVQGQQMVEAMNAAGIDLVTFGNHEFDIKENALQSRLNESKFEWLGTSVRYHNTKTGVDSKFYKETDSTKQYVPDTWTWKIMDEDGTEIKVGFFGATLPMNPRDYVIYEDFTTRTLEAVQTLSTQADVVIGLTHVDEADDLKLAGMLPQVPLIMGGHDHHHMKHKVGNTVVTKADANAKTAYVHEIVYDKNTRQTKVNSRLVPINDQLHKDEYVEEIVRKWKRVMDSKMADLIDNPYAIIYRAKEPLDGRESVNRLEQTNLGRIVNLAMTTVAKEETDFTLFNSGSMRIDDQLSGALTAVDVFRTFPFGGALVELDIKGALVIKIMEEGEQKKGTGAYLQRNKIWYSDKNKSWMVGNEKIDPEKTYHTITTDYLLLGIDIENLKTGTPGLIKIDRHNEEDPEDGRRSIVLAIVNYLKAMSPE